MEYYENIRGKFKIIDDSIDYYMVMAESSIYYLKKYDNYYDKCFVQYSMFLEEEFRVKEDIKERNFAEYLRYLFYNEYNIDYIYKLIDRCNGIFNFDIVIARLLFPSYYFYYLEKGINNNSFDGLKRVIDKTSEYEKYLSLIAEKMNSFLVKKIVLPF